MRPCNQCGEPVENSASYCEKCASQQQDGNMDPAAQKKPRKQSPSHRTWWIWQMLEFEVISVIFAGGVGGLLGYKLYGICGAVFGFMVGCVAGFVLLFMNADFS